LMRKAVLSLAVDHPSLRSLINPRQTSAITYSTSNLNVADETPDAFAAGPEPGAILPECPVTMMNAGHATEAHLTDLLRPGFTAIYFSEDGTIPAAFADFAPRVQGNALPFAVVPVSAHLNEASKSVYGWDHTGQLFSMYGARPGAVYLVRPDGHVLGRWQSANVGQITVAIEHALA
ncbi:MAG TPA: FAD-dependent oxidoreductase, partial [Paraburkholderia sp.]|nr:FAD-dependent oxidoreductase [Paraburkholderia sp.]